MSVDDLDEHSRSFAQRLLALYPEWMDHATVHRPAHMEADYLVVEVPAPEGADSSTKLLIHTDNGEVTVGYDYYHVHFGWPPPDAAPPSWIEPIAFIAAILNEELAAGSDCIGERWSGSGSYKKVGTACQPSLMAD